MAAELRKGQPSLSRGRLDRGSYGGRIKERPFITEQEKIGQRQLWRPN